MSKKQNTVVLINPGSIISDKEIGDRIVKLREERNISQQTVADMVGISRQYLGMIELGKSSPRVKTLQEIVATCGRTLPDFLEVQIPDMYSDPNHRRVHALLQRILEIGGEAESMIKVMIDSVLNQAAFGQKGGNSKPKTRK